MSTSISKAIEAHNKSVEAFYAAEKKAKATAKATDRDWLVKEVDWAVCCAVWEIVIYGEPECLCYDNYCDMTKADQKYYVSQYRTRLTQFKKTWKAMPEAKKKEIKTQ